MRKLKARERLYSNGAEIGLPFDVAIVYGRDQEQTSESSRRPASSCRRARSTRQGANHEGRHAGWTPRPGGGPRRRERRAGPQHGDCALARLAGAAAEPPWDEDVAAMLELGRDLVLAVNDVIANETGRWITGSHSNLERAEQSLGRSDR